jgi:hypothetical protein
MRIIGPKMQPKHTLDDWLVKTYIGKMVEVQRN